MIYTTTALSPHNEELRQRLQSRVREIRHWLKGDLYRRYLVKVLDRLNDNQLPEDWLALSSEVLSKVISEATGELLLSSTRALPRRLLSGGFEFQFPYLEDSLRHVLGKAR